MTKAQRDALKWLKEHGGDGCRQGPCRQQVLAQGEIAPFMWSTFTALALLGMVDLYGRPDWRVRVTPKGLST